MAKPISIKKVIQEKLAILTIKVFEQLSKGKATDKVKKSLAKSSRKASRAVHSLLKKNAREKAKKAKKEKKALAKQKKKSVVKKRKKSVRV